MVSTREPVFPYFLQCSCQCKHLVLLQAASPWSADRCAHCYKDGTVQSLGCVSLFVTPWTAACQTFLSITNSRSLLRLMSVESVMPSNCLILCCPASSCLESFPASGSFPMSQLLSLGGQNIGASVSVLTMNIQG